LHSRIAPNSYADHSACYEKLILYVVPRNWIQHHYVSFLSCYAKFLYLLISVSHLHGRQGHRLCENGQNVNKGDNQARQNCFDHSVLGAYVNCLQHRLQSFQEKYASVRLRLMFISCNTTERWCFAKIAPLSLDPVHDRGGLLTGKQLRYNNTVTFIGYFNRRTAPLQQHRYTTPLRILPHRYEFYSTVTICKHAPVGDSVVNCNICSAK